MSWLHGLKGLRGLFSSRSSGGTDSTPSKISEKNDLWLIASVSDTPDRPPYHKNQALLTLGCFQNGEQDGATCYLYVMENALLLDEATKSSLKPGCWIEAETKCFGPYLPTYQIVNFKLRPDLGTVENVRVEDRPFSDIFADAGDVFSDKPLLPNSP